MAPKNFQVVVTCKICGLVELFEEIYESDCHTIAICPNWARSEQQIRMLREKGITIVDTDDMDRPPTLPPVDVLYANLRVDLEFFFGEYFDNLQCRTLIFHDAGGFSVPKARRPLISSVIVSCASKCISPRGLVSRLLVNKYRFDEIDALWGHCQAQQSPCKLKFDLRKNTVTVVPESRLPTDKNAYLLEATCPTISLKLAFC